jgi:predicted DNA-binding transcriptional regulator YafY
MELNNVKYSLIPKYAFKTQILKMGPEAEVVFPISLVKEIQRMLKKTLNKYD